MNTAVYMLRAYQIGIDINDMDELDMGDVIDMIIESGNDEYEYPLKATQNDINKMFN